MAQGLHFVDDPSAPPATPLAPEEQSERLRVLLPVIRVGEEERRSFRWNTGEQGVALYGDRLVIFQRRRWLRILQSVLSFALLLFLIGVIVLLVIVFIRLR